MQASSGWCSPLTTTVAPSGTESTCNDTTAGATGSAGFAGFSAAAEVAASTGPGELPLIIFAPNTTASPIRTTPIATGMTHLFFAAGGGGVGSAIGAGGKSSCFAARTSASGLRTVFLRGRALRASRRRSSAGSTAARARGRRRSGSVRRAPWPAPSPRPPPAAAADRRRLVQRRRVLSQDLDDGRGRSLADERLASGEQLVEHDADRENVGAPSTVSLPLTCSATCTTRCHTSPCRVSVDDVSSATPKSSSFTVPSGMMKMFAGLMSR